MSDIKPVPDNSSAVMPMLVCRDVVWTVASRVEETTEEERKERLERIFPKSKPSGK